MACSHNHRIGDNYGVTCQDCGEPLEGYGYWASTETCQHRWIDNGDGWESCLYCEATRQRDESSDSTA